MKINFVDPWPAEASPMDRWSLNSCRHAGPYLVSLGVVSIVARAEPTATAWWSGCGYLHFDLPAERVVEILVDVASTGDWRASLAGTGHICYAQTGRRNLGTHVPTAREHLATMSAEQRTAELLALLGIGDLARYTVPSGLPYPQRAGINGLYCAGTLWPDSVPHDNRMPEGLSAWNVALAWEAKSWLADGLVIERIADSPGWHPMMNDPQGPGNQGALWWTPIWRCRMEARRARVLFRPRGKFSPAGWNRWAHLGWRAQTREIEWLAFRVGTFLGGHSLEIVGPVQPTDAPYYEMRRRQHEVTRLARLEQHAAKAAPKKRRRRKVATK